MKGLIRVSSALLNALQNELTLDKEQLTSVEDVCMKYAQSQRNDECHFLGETGLKSVHKLPVHKLPKLVSFSPLCHRGQQHSR